MQPFRNELRHTSNLSMPAIKFIGFTILSFLPAGSVAGLQVGVFTRRLYGVFPLSDNVTSYLPAITLRGGKSKLEE